jgi:hypothetical protein
MLPEDDLSIETCRRFLNVLIWILMCILEFIILQKVYLFVYIINKLQNAQSNDKDVGSYLDSCGCKFLCPNPVLLTENSFFSLITSRHTRECIEWRHGVFQSHFWYWLFGIHHVIWHHLKLAFVNTSLPLQWRFGLRVHCPPGWRASKFTVTLYSFTNVQYTGPSKVWER